MLDSDRLLAFAENRFAELHIKGSNGIGRGAESKVASGNKPGLDRWQEKEADIAKHVNNLRKGTALR